MMNADLKEFVVRLHKPLKNYTQGEVVELLMVLGLHAYVPRFGSSRLTRGQQDQWPAAHGRQRAHAREAVHDPVAPAHQEDHQW